ncbi:MAG: N-acetylglucosamine-6-phosphate deacetylase [Lagierella massiliensis]|nr:N-acetylglucosamine-6-phosphate deacetylase [Lagierella massiliensis]
MKKYIKGGKVFLKDEILNDAYIEIENERIKKILDSIPEDEEFIDYSEYTIAPGYVDTHVHGYGGYDIMDLREESLGEISKGVAKLGVTTFLPTTLTAKTEDLNKACENIYKAHEKVEGAKVGGIFLEGPFFTLKHKGAQNPSYLVKPDIEKLKQWQKISHGLIKKIAIAPEYENSVEFIKKAKSLGIYVALGHSDATYDQAYDAVMAGASIFVHIYNGMSGLHHRNPGMVGAGLTLKNVFSEIICDGHHVHPAAAEVVMKCRGKEETLLITDCMMAGGMPDGDYKLGELDVIVKDGAANLTTGSLAGSVLKLKDAVKNVVDWGIATPFEAVLMASLVPAKSVGLDDEVGSIEAGKFADINVLDDNLDIVTTFINGKEVER